MAVGHQYDMMSWGCDKCCHLISSPCWPGAFIFFYRRVKVRDPIINVCFLADAIDLVLPHGMHVSLAPCEMCSHRYRWLISRDRDLWCRPWPRERQLGTARHVGVASWRCIQRRRDVLDYGADTRVHFCNSLQKGVYMWKTFAKRVKKQKIAVSKWITN